MSEEKVIDYVFEDYDDVTENNNNKSLDEQLLLEVTKSYLRRYFVVKSLLENGANVNVHDSISSNRGQLSILQYIIRDNLMDLFDLIVSYKPDINYQDDNGTTALMWSVYNDYMFRKLIMLGADIYIVNHSEKNILDILVKQQTYCKWYNYTKFIRVSSRLGMEITFDHLKYIIVRSRYYNWDDEPCRLEIFIQEGGFNPLAILDEDKNIFQYVKEKYNSAIEERTPYYARKIEIVLDLLDNYSRYHHGYYTIEKIFKRKPYFTRDVFHIISKYTGKK